MLSAIRNYYKKGRFQRFEIIVGTLFLLAMIPTLRNITEENDVNIFYLAASCLREGRSMYDGPQMYGMWYYYSPLFAALLVPFTYMPMQVIKLVILVLNLLMLRRCYLLSKRMLDFGNTAAGVSILITLAIACVYPVYMNLLYGQMTIFIVWSCFEGLVQAQKMQAAKGAAALAAGINVKILPIFLFWYLLLKKEFKFMVYVGIALGISILIPYLFIEFQFHNSLISQWLGLLNPLNREHVNTVGEGGFIDFGSIVTKYFTHYSVRNETQLNVTHWEHNTVLAVQMAYRAAILILTAWMIKILKRNSLPEGQVFFTEISFFLLCIISAFPHQRDYSVFMAAPALLLVLQLYTSNRSKAGILLPIVTAVNALAMGFVLFPKFLGKAARHFIFETRMPGIASILFIAIFIAWLYRYNMLSLKSDIEKSK
jgi:Glycosyltransferase family 87